MSISTARRGQSSIEIMPFLGLAFVLFIVIMVFVSGRLAEVKDQDIQEELATIATLLDSEIRMAVSVSDGYERNFTIPSQIRGVNYTIQIINQATILASTDDYEASLVIFNVTGQPMQGNNIIRKNNGTISLN